MAESDKRRPHPRPPATANASVARAAAPTISAVILTKNGARRLHRCLESIQKTNFADEVVVCVDADTTDQSFEVAQSFTHRVHFLQVKGCIESVLPQMTSLCSGDFVLRIDDDECIAGNWDREQFQMLAGFDDISCALIPRRWVVPPGDSFIASEPWFPDLQLRLFRNDLGRISWPQEVHAPMTVAGRSIVLFDRWFDHFALVDTSRQEREQKCQEYLKLRPGFDLSSFYLWEESDIRIMSCRASGFAAATNSAARMTVKSPNLYCLGTDVSFCSSGNGSDYTLRGWSVPESWGTWTEGNEAEICLPLETAIDGDAILTVHAGAYVGEQHPLVRIDVLYRDGIVGEWSFDRSSVVTRKLVISAHLIAGDRKPFLRFQIFSPASPLALGESADGRLLGLGFQRLSLERRIAAGQQHDD